MISAGTNSELPCSVNRPRSRPPSWRLTPSAMPSSSGRVGPEQLEEARQQAVDEAARVAGDRAEDRGQDHRDERRHGADEQRGAPAVEQAHRDVAAVDVGAEQEVTGPGRPDRDPGRTERVVDLRLVVGPDVGDVGRVDRRQQAEDDDQQEQAAERQRQRGCAAAAARRSGRARVPAAGRHRRAGTPRLRPRNSARRGTRGG